MGVPVEGSVCVGQHTGRQGAGVSRLFDLPTGRPDAVSGQPKKLTMLRSNGQRLNRLCLSPGSSMADSPCHSFLSLVIFSKKRNYVLYICSQAARERFNEFLQMASLPADECTSSASDASGARQQQRTASS
jgi:hypothetical protein